MRSMLPQAISVCPSFRGNIPTFIHISDGKLHDVNVLDILLPEPGAFYIMDRGHVDFGRLFTLHLAGSFFVIRTKSNTRYRRRYSHPVEKSGGVRCDQTIVLTGANSIHDYPQPLRRIKYHNVQTGKTFNFGCCLTGYRNSQELCKSVGREF